MSGIESKWVEEAEKQGWQFLKKLPVHGRSLYQHSCGHVAAFQNTAMRNGTVKCSACFAEKCKTEALNNGWVWSFQEDGNYSRYTHIACGQQSVLQHVHMRAGVCNCKPCKIQTWKQECKDEGFEWLSQKDKSYSVYKCVECGVDRILAMSAFRTGNVKCLNCYETRLKLAAEDFNWTFIERTTEGRSVFRHFCGYEQEVKHRAIRYKTARCLGCEDSWLLTPCKIYLVIISTKDTAFVKLGMSSSPEDRYYNYGIKDLLEIKTVLTKDFQTGAICAKVEKGLHNKYKHLRLAPETMKCLMKNGFTECYPLSMLSVFENDLSLI